MTRFSAAALLLLAFGTAAPLMAQPADVIGPVLRDVRPGSETVIEQLDPSDARQTRRQLQQLLAEHPPAIRVVLGADPSLLNRPDYLAPYPRLAAFLKQHPEVARDPAFFFGSGMFSVTVDRTPQDRALDTLEGVLAGLAVFTVVITVLLVLGSLFRQAIEHRRWARQSRVQTEVHTKILDRLQSNEDLLAYVQTPAGQRFLESGPSPRDSEPRTIAAPLGRILWSVQAGVVLVALGVAFWLVQRSVIAEIAPAFRAMGIIAAMLGIGAVASAGVSYAISARMGLLGAPKG